MEWRTPEANGQLADEFLEPLKAVKVSGGQFDVVTQGWRVPHKLTDDMPFRILFEERPPEPAATGGSTNNSVSQPSSWKPL
ncbi:MAG: hypothetical protein Q9164_000980 [Protoblastenia rupestris]